MSKDGKKIAAGYSNGIVRIYQKNNTYTLKQEINASTLKIETLSGTDNFEILVAGGAEKKIFIYKDNNNILLLNQTINVGKNLKTLKVTAEGLMASGQGPLIWLYSSNGTQFVFQQSIVTSEFNVLRSAINDDFSTVVYGGSKKTLNVHKLNSNNSYDLVFAEVIGSFIHHNLIDSNGLYFPFMTLSG